MALELMLKDQSFARRLQTFIFWRFCFSWRRSQVAKAEVCKTFTIGSNPIAASNYSNA
jgi:hypothetical protein